MKSVAFARTKPPSTVSTSRQSSQPRKGDNAAPDTRLYRLCPGRSSAPDRVAKRGSCSWAFFRTAFCLRSCILSGAERCASSARDRQPAVNEGTMKKSLNKAEVVNQVDADEILPEYDFSRASPNKFASRYTKGSAVVVLEPDVDR